MIKNKPHSSKAIFLIGFMASGKSTIGKHLAGLLEANFIDLDQWIETKTGSSISDIFQEKGADYFRKLEQKALRTIIKKVGKGEEQQPKKIPKKWLIATGGGTPCFFDNLKLMKECGQVFYLKATEEVIFNRLKKKQLAISQRPLLKKANNAEALRFFIQQKLAERKDIYEQADAVIVVEEEQPVRLICEQIQAYLRVSA